MRELTKDELVVLINRFDPIAVVVHGPSVAHISLIGSEEDVLLLDAHLMRNCWKKEHKALEKMSKINTDYMPLVIEEAAEVIQSITKIQRFGPDRRYPNGDHAGETNIYALAMEVGDLLEVIARLELPAEVVERGRVKKQAQLKKWGPERTDNQLDDNLAELLVELNEKKRD